MAAGEKLNRNKLDYISHRCAVSSDLLNEIKSKIAQIIKYKKAKQDDTLVHEKNQKDELYRRQVVEFTKAIENLVKINNSIESAATKVKELCMEAHRLLVKEEKEG